MRKSEKVRSSCGEHVTGNRLVTCGEEPNVEIVPTVPVDTAALGGQTDQNTAGTGRPQ